MATMAPPEDTVAFSMPGGGRCETSRGRPIDMVHLARQTMDDRALEQEVLGLFAQQIASAQADLLATDSAGRLRIAHTLKGSARGIGAFALADCAEAIEADPADAEAIKRLGDQIGEVCDFIAAISR